MLWASLVPPGWVVRHTHVASRADTLLPHDVCLSDRLSCCRDCSQNHCFIAYGGSAVTLTQLPSKSRRYQLCSRRRSKTQVKKG